LCHRDSVIASTFHVTDVYHLPSFIFIGKFSKQLQTSGGSWRLGAPSGSLFFLQIFRFYIYHTIHLYSDSNKKKDLLYLFSPFERSEQEEQVTAHTLQQQNMVNQSDGKAARQTSMCHQMRSSQQKGDASSRSPSSVGAEPRVMQMPR